MKSTKIPIVLYLAIEYSYSTLQGLVSRSQSSLVTAKIGWVQKPKWTTPGQNNPTRNNTYQAEWREDKYTNIKIRVHTGCGTKSMIQFSQRNRRVSADYRKQRRTTADSNQNTLRKLQQIPEKAEYSLLLYVVSGIGEYQTEKKLTGKCSGIVERK